MVLPESDPSEQATSSSEFTANYLVLRGLNLGLACSCRQGTVVALPLCWVTKLRVGFWSSISILSKPHADLEGSTQEYPFLVDHAFHEWDQCKKSQLFIKELKESNAGYWEFSNSVVKKTSQLQCWYLVSWYQHWLLALNSSKILKTLSRQPFPGHSLQLKSEFSYLCVDQVNCSLIFSFTWKIILAVSELFFFSSKYIIS